MVPNNVEQSPSPESVALGARHRKKQLVRYKKFKPGPTFKVKDYEAWIFRLTHAETPPPTGINLFDSIEELEKKFIDFFLTKFGDVKESAKRLGINEHTLRLKISKYRL